MPDAAALATKHNPSTRGRREYGEKKNDFKRERPKCDHCGWVGHTIEKCYHIHGFPPDHPRSQKTNSKSSANQISSSANDCKQSSIGFPFSQEQ